MYRTTLKFRKGYFYGQYCTSGYPVPDNLSKILAGAWRSKMLAVSDGWPKPRVGSTINFSSNIIIVILTLFKL